MAINTFQQDLIDTAKFLAEQNQQGLIEIYKAISKQLLEIKLWEYEIMHNMGVENSELKRIQKHIDKEIAKDFKEKDSKNE